MSRWRAARWWALTLPLLPVLIPLALFTRRQALRLPEAAGARQGIVGTEHPGMLLRVMLVGESPVVGVGVEQLDDALAAQLARALAERLQRPVLWQICGENGLTAGQAVSRLLPEAQGIAADWVVLVFGVNDTTQLTSIGAWRQALLCLCQALGKSGQRVVLTAVPPLQHFRALPWLLRQVLGARARLLDAVAREVALSEAAQHLALELPFQGDYLALDGFHPSAAGYRAWAQGLAAQLALPEA